MIGLALQGGGARGAYQAGACMALKKARIKFDGVCGTSIGAINGAMVACGKEKELLELWKNMDMGKILGFDEKFLEKKEKKEHDFAYYRLGFLNYKKIITERGINTKGIEKIIKKHINEEELRNNKVDYGICTIRLNDLKPLYVFKEDMIKGKLYDYILASCYLPIFKMEKKVDEHYYLDGGFYDNTPLNMLIEKGYKKIYVVELNPLLNINKKPKKDVEIIRISPKRSLGGIINFDKEKINEIIKMGYYDTLRVIKKLDGHHYCFKRRPNLFYKWITRNISEKEKKRLQGFFNIKTEKEMVIKSLEYIMKNEKINYFHIYKPYKMIQEIQKKYSKKHFVYNFIRKLKLL